MNEELKVIISAEVAKLKQGVNEAKSALGIFKSEITKNKDEISKAWTSMGKGATKASKFIIGGVAGIGAALVSTSALTTEYRTEQAKLTTAFETAGMSAEQAKTTYNGLYRVLGDSGVAVEAANHLAKLTDDEQSLSEWTTICTGVYATFGDSLPIEGLTEAANETAKTGELTGNLADALNWAGVNEDEFQAKLDACNTEAEREALIRETLNGLYGDAAANYEKNNEALIAQNEAQAKLTETLAELGAAVAPIITIFAEFATQALAVVVPYVQQLAEQYGPQLQTVLKGIGDFLAPIAEFIANNLPLIATIAGIILGIAAAYQVVSTALTIYNGIKTAYTTITTIATAAQTAFAAANLAALGPILLVVAAIAVVIAIIIICIKYWDEIKATVINAANIIWNQIKWMAEEVGKFFKNLWKTVTDTAKSIWKNVSEFFVKLWNDVSSAVSGMWTSVTTWFTNMKNSVVEKVTAIWTTVKEKFEAIKTAISDKVKEAKEAVVNKFTEIKTNITNKVTEAKTAVVNKFNEIKNGIKEKVDSAKETVSNVFTNIKTTMSNTLTSAKNTVVNIFNSIKDSIKDKIDGAKDAVKSAIDKIKDFFNFEWKWPKIKLPHFKVSGSINPVDWFTQGVPKLSVSWYAHGGVFDKPTLFNYGGNVGGLGEAGAEAIVPLEKNTEWLDRIAERLSEKSGNQPIILEVDGKVFAQTSIDTINQLTRQTGTLGLNIV